MKKNSIMTIIVIALIAVLIFVGAIVIINLNNNKTKNTETYSDYKDVLYDELDKYSANDGKYSSYSSLKEVYSTELSALNGEIIDIYGTEDGLFVSTKNKVYGGRLDIEEQLSSKKTIKSIIFATEYAIILQNSDNTRSAYIQQYNEGKTSFKEIQGLELNNAIYLNSLTSYNYIIVINKTGNGYNVDKYEVDDNYNITAKESNYPIYLNDGYLGSSVEQFESIGNLKHMYVNGDRLIMTASNGVVYETGLNTGFTSYKNPVKYLEHQIRTTDGELEDVNIIYGEGSIGYYKRPLFERNGDTNNLYTYNREVSSMTSGMPEEQYKITIPLPNGYTTNDIKNVVIEENLLIEFNDSNIYIADKSEPSKLLLNEEISTLNKSGKIKKIALYEHGSDIVALMDDNCIYRIDI